jgi:hypothetical protein
VPNIGLLNFSEDSSNIGTQNDQQTEAQCPYRDMQWYIPSHRSISSSEAAWAGHPIDSLSLLSFVQYSFFPIRLLSSSPSFRLGLATRPAFPWFFSLLFGFLNGG